MLSTFPPGKGEGGRYGGLHQVSALYLDESGFTGLLQARAPGITFELSSVILLGQ